MEKSTQVKTQDEEKDRKNNEGTNFISSFLLNRHERLKSDYYLDKNKINQQEMGWKCQVPESP